MPLGHSPVLCEVINCVLAPRLCQIASGSASGFFRNGSHCRKVGVNLCLGYLSGHTLAEPWHLFQRISRCNGLRDALLAGRQALHIHDQAFTDHSAWVCVGFGTKWEHSGHHSGGNRYPKACRAGILYKGSLGHENGAVSKGRKERIEQNDICTGHFLVCRLCGHASSAPHCISGMSSWPSAQC